MAGGTKLEDMEILRQDEPHMPDAKRRTNVGR
jgi:hypothetical protein